MAHAKLRSPAVPVRTPLVSAWSWPLTVACARVAPMAGEVFRATLRGSDATLGVVRASDVARLLIGLESAVAAAAYAALGKPRRGSTGRHRAAIEAASRLHFQNVEPGSVVAVLRLPRLAEVTDGTFDVEVDDLAGAAFDPPRHLLHPT